MWTGRGYICSCGTCSGWQQPGGQPHIDGSASAAGSGGVASLSRGRGRGGEGQQGSGGLAVVGAGSRAWLRRRLQSGRSACLPPHACRDCATRPACSVHAYGSLCGCSQPLWLQPASVAAASLCGSKQWQLLERLRLPACLPAWLTWIMNDLMMRWNCRQTGMQADILSSKTCIRAACKAGSSTRSSLAGRRQQQWGHGVVLAAVAKGCHALPLSVTHHCAVVVALPRQLQKVLAGPGGVLGIHLQAKRSTTQEAARRREGGQEGGSAYRGLAHGWHSVCWL
jgi:hypothetical protein